MEAKERIKQRIKALLAKTTENGATEQEAISAMQLAQRLMVDYFISEREITEEEAQEKCVFKYVDIIPSAYDFSVFYFYLAQLFDCECHFNHLTITFFGYKEDTELCAYFYNFIVKACLNEKDKYKKSSAYKNMCFYSHGRTLMASFVRGFLRGISEKMEKMYQARKSQVSHETGLIIIEKRQRVKEQYDAENLELYTPRKRSGIYDAIAYEQGMSKGENISITQGISDHKQQSVLMIE